MSDKIKPCPFCGGTNIKPREGLEWSDVTCMDCRQSVISFPCASEGIWNTRPIEDAFQARIAELELILAADKLIEDGWIGRIEAGDKRIAELEANEKTFTEMCSAYTARIANLEAENAKLRASAVMWHKYPDEEPEPSHEYEVNIPLIVVIKTSHCWTDFAYYNLDSFRFWRHGNKEEDVTHWAYLPDAGTVCGGINVQITNRT